jgi:hypothetical protein
MQTQQTSLLLLAYRQKLEDHTPDEAFNEIMCEYVGACMDLLYKDIPTKAACDAATRLAPAIKHFIDTNDASKLLKETYECYLLEKLHERIEQLGIEQINVELYDFILHLYYLGIDNTEFVKYTPIVFRTPFTTVKSTPERKPVDTTWCKIRPRTELTQTFESEEEEPPKKKRKATKSKSVPKKKSASTEPGKKRTRTKPPVVVSFSDDDSKATAIGILEGQINRQLREKRGIIAHYTAHDNDILCRIIGFKGTVLYAEYPLGSGDIASVSTIASYCAYKIGHHDNPKGAFSVSGYTGLTIYPIDDSSPKGHKLGQLFGVKARQGELLMSLDDIKCVVDEDDADNFEAIGPLSDYRLVKKRTDFEDYEE